MTPREEALTAALEKSVEALVEAAAYLLGLKAPVWAQGAENQAGLALDLLKGRRSISYEEVRTVSESERADYPYNRESRLEINALLEKARPGIEESYRLSRRLCKGEKWLNQRSVIQELRDIAEEREHLTAREKHVKSACTHQPWGLTDNDTTIVPYGDTETVCLVCHTVNPSLKWGDGNDP